MIQLLTRLGQKSIKGCVNTPRIIKLLNTESFEVIDLRDDRMICICFSNYQRGVYVNMEATRLLQSKYPKLMIRVFGDALVFSVHDMTPVEKHALRQIDQNEIHL